LESVTCEFAALCAARHRRAAVGVDRALDDRQLQRQGDGQPEVRALRRAQADDTHELQEVAHGAGGVVVAARRLPRQLLEGLGHAGGLHLLAPRFGLLAVAVGNK
jgi:hypothetical protein